MQESFARVRTRSRPARTTIGYLVHMGKPELVYKIHYRRVRAWPCVFRPSARASKSILRSRPDHASQHFQGGSGYMLTMLPM